MTVILLRHGRSTSNTAYTLAGRTDGIDLDETGREQALALVDRIGSLPIRAIVRPRIHGSGRRHPSSLEAPSSGVLHRCQ